MWRHFRFCHISRAYKSEISPHDNFFSTYLICDICDKYEVCSQVCFQPAHTTTVSKDINYRITVTEKKMMATLYKSHNTTQLMQCWSVPTSPEFLVIMLRSELFSLPRYGQLDEEATFYTLLLIDPICLYHVLLFSLGVGIIS